MRRAERCCRPTEGKVRLLTVMPSERCSNESSITVFSRYHVTRGRGFPTNKNKQKVRHYVKDGIRQEVFKRALWNGQIYFVIKFDKLLLESLPHYWGS